jgi:hypothetical protein
MTTTLDSSIEATLQTFRASTAARALIPWETSLSLPVPFRRDDQAFLSVLLFSTSRDQSHTNLVLYAPWACATICRADGQLARFEDYTRLPPFHGAPKANTPIGVFPHPTIAKLTPAEYKARRQQLLLETDTLLDTGTVSDTYRRLWCLLMETALAPYYWSIAPRYLREILGGSEASKAVACQHADI